MNAIVRPTSPGMTGLGIQTPSSLLDGLVCCPKCCDSRLDRSTVDGSSAFICAQCATCFPLFVSDVTKDGSQGSTLELPWLFADPQGARAEWKARYNGFLHANADQQARLHNALRDRSANARSRQRFEHLANATNSYRAQISQLVSLFEFDTLTQAPSAQVNLPKNQGMVNYISNVFRDWSWNNGENESLLAAVSSVLPTDAQLGKTLTLGAGAGRLSYDLHQRFDTELSVLLDINPLLGLFASRMINGQSVELTEFPIAPLTLDDVAVLQHCESPSASMASDGRFAVVLADAMNPPFAQRSFDTVFTPWLIDIVPHDLTSLASRVNRLLSPGGMWLNSGSLAFFHEDPAWCYSEEETLELVERQGFEIISTKRTTVPYLQSPHSAHGRLERLLSFSARKVEECSVIPQVHYQPSFLRVTSEAVPERPEFTLASSQHLLQAQVLAAIDGKRSVNAIARLVAKQYGLDVPDAEHAVKQILSSLAGHS